MLEPIIMLKGAFLPSVFLLSEEADGGAAAAIIAAILIIIAPL